MSRVYSSVYHYKDKRRHIHFAQTPLRRPPKTEKPLLYVVFALSDRRHMMQQIYPQKVQSKIRQSTGSANPHSGIVTAGILLPQLHHLRVTQTALEGTQSLWQSSAQSCHAAAPCLTASRGQRTSLAASRGRGRRAARTGCAAAMCVNKVPPQGPTCASHNLV